MRLVSLMLTLLLTLVPLARSAAAQQFQAAPQAPPSRITSPAPATTGGFLGGVPSGTATGDVMTITVLDAIRRALDHNLGVLTAEQGINRAGGARWRALSDLLPNVNARVGETRQRINLAAFGFGSSPGSPFADLPSIVGPFNVFDARLYVSQAIVDLGALNHSRAASHDAEAARHLFTNARNFVIHVAGNLYIQALAAESRAAAARAQRDTAGVLFTQAQDLKQAGIIAGIDVLRAEVQLNTETQRATAAENDAEKVKLQLARAIGLPLGQRFALDPNLPELPDPDLTLEQAIDAAYRSRPDYQAALERVKAAEATRQAVAGDRLPTVRVNADYGEIGLTPGDARMTFSVAGAVNVPIFQGGRQQGDRLEAEADLRNRRAEAEDLRASIYYEIRAAFLDLQASSQQLQVATKARDLAAQQLTQSRDRFAAGVASNIEVVQAQEAVALTAEQYISARYGYDLAKGALIRGTGASQAVLRQLLGGSR
ncbi:MAG TPA: TolC family protein [Vicinamibacterales bacterium]|nr:TolC family protein [Vicinamibacterales bacterium]